MTNAIDNLAKGSRSGYLGVSLIIAAVPALMFYVLGLEPYLYSGLLIYGFLFFFLINTRWGSKVLITTRDMLFEKAEPASKKVVADRINRLATRYIFNPVPHLFFGVAVVAAGLIITYIMNRLEWFLVPSAIIFGLMIGVGGWLYVWIIYSFNVVASEFVGTRCLVKALDPDRMGGYKFVADAMVSFIALVSVLLGFVIAVLMAFAVQIVEALNISLLLVSLGLGVILGGYVFIIAKMHKVFVSEKGKVAEDMSQVLASAERIIGSVAKNIESAEQWEQVVEQIRPYSMPILSLKVIIDEVRLMRDWPIDIPIILKLLGGVSVSIILVVFQVILQTFIIPVP